MRPGCAESGWVQNVAANTENTRYEFSTSRMSLTEVWYKKELRILRQHGIRTSTNNISQLLLASCQNRTELIITVSTTTVLQ